MTEMQRVRMDARQPASRNQITFALDGQALVLSNQSAVTETRKLLQNNVMTITRLLLMVVIRPAISNMAIFGTLLLIKHIQFVEMAKKLPLKPVMIIIY